MPASTPKWDSNHFLMWRTKSKNLTTDISQITSILGGVFKEQSSSAFAIFKFMQSLSAAIAFFYSPYLRWTNDLVLEPFLNLRWLQDYTSGENFPNYFVISFFQFTMATFGCSDPWHHWHSCFLQGSESSWQISRVPIDLSKKHILHWIVTNCWMVLSAQHCIPVIPPITSPAKTNTTKGISWLWSPK